MDDLVRDMGWPRYRSQQILRWIHQHRVREIERMTSLSLAERARLNTVARVGRFDDCRAMTSTDGTAAKAPIPAERRTRRNR